MLFPSVTCQKKPPFLRFTLFVLQSQLLTRSICSAVPFYYIVENQKQKKERKNCDFGIQIVKEKIQAKYFILLHLKIVNLFAQFPSCRNANSAECKFCPIENHFLYFFICNLIEHNFKLKNKNVMNAEKSILNLCEKVLLFLTKSC